MHGHLPSHFYWWLLMNRSFCGFFSFLTKIICLINFLLLWKNSSCPLVEKMCEMKPHSPEDVLPFMFRRLCALPSSFGPQSSSNGFVMLSREGQALFFPMSRALFSKSALPRFQQGLVFAMSRVGIHMCNLSFLFHHTA